MSQMKDLRINEDGAPTVTMLRQEGLRVVVKADCIEIMVVPSDGSGPVVERIPFMQISKARIMIEEEVRFRNLKVKRAANE